MARVSVRSRVERFYRSLSPASRLWLYAAIFFVIAPVELLSSTSLSGPHTWWVILGHLLLSGLFAVGGAYAVINDLRILFIILPLGFGGFLYLQQFSPAPPSLLGLACGTLILVGYLLFIRFINREGAAALRLQTEVLLAQRIHRELVPKVNRTTSNLEFFGYSLSSTEVGGDLVDLVEHEDRYLLCIADVVGHGVPAGVVMAMVKSGLRMRLLQAEDSGSLLDDLDQVVQTLGGEGMFVTFAGIEVSPSSAAYAMAGHLPVLHYDASENVVRRHTAGGVPLGLRGALRQEDDGSYGWHHASFDRGDVLVLLTDGLTEVFDDHGEELGLDPLENVIVERAGDPIAELCEALFAAARDHGPQTDDQSILMVRKRR